MAYMDRYIALGIPYPEPATCCLGQCEGTGFVPHKKGGGFKTGQEPDGHDWDLLWEKQHRVAHNPFNIIRTAWRYKDIKWLWHGFECDGWHFVKCPDCNGTGKQPKSSPLNTDGGEG